MDGSVSGGGSGGSPMGNVYTVEHLATFGLSEDLAFPADGMRRLLHMERAGFGIWSQKMRIRLEYRYIVILDYENGVSSAPLLSHSIFLHMPYFVFILLLNYVVSMCSCLLVLVSLAGKYT